MPDFPFSTATPATFTGTLPKSCDVVIIGGGIVGVMTAWFLARRGLKAVLCEKGRIAGEQSSRNWGWVRQQGRDPAELPIMMEANRIWRGLETECAENLGYRQTGVLYMADTDVEMNQFESWLSLAKAHGLDTRLLNTAGVGEQLPGAGNAWKGGLLTPSDGRAEPWQAVPALARAAQRVGTGIYEDCAVRTLDCQAGKIVGVVTEKGRIGCDQVVLAGGAWSGLFARNLGVNLPQLSVLGSVAATSPMPAVFEGAAASSKFAFRRRQDGGYTIAPGTFHEFYLGPDAFRHFRKYLPQVRRDFRGTRYHLAAPRGYPDAWGTSRRWSGDSVSPFENMRVLNPKPNLTELKKALDYFSSVFSKTPPPEIRRAWAGMIDTMPDTLPIIDRVPELPGLIIATGMSGHGFGIGPAIGRIVADIAAEQAPGHDLNSFRFSRFTDGSKIEPSPAF